MSRGVAAAVICWLLASCDNAPTRQSGLRVAPENFNNPRAIPDLHTTFDANYTVAREARIGAFKMPDGSKILLDSAHRRVMAALSSRDEVAFRTAIREFWNIPVGVVRERANTVSMFSHGSGPGGSSAVFAKGVSDGASIANAMAQKGSIINGVMCSYLFGYEYGGCRGDELVELFQRVENGDVTIASIEQFVRLGPD